MRYFKLVYTLFALLLIAIIVGSSYSIYRSAKADIYSSLVMWYTLDSNDVSGTSVTDRSATGLLGATEQNGSATVLSQVPTILGQGLSLNSSLTQYVGTNALNLTSSNWTWVGWFYPTADAGSISYIGMMYSRNSPSSPGFGYGYNVNNQLGYEWNGDSGNEFQFNSGLIVQKNKWQLAALVITAGSPATLYLCTVPGGCASASHTPSPADTSETINAELDIGNDSCCAGRGFPGSIDDPRVYTRALSAAEIQQLFYQGESTHGGAGAF